MDEDEAGTSGEAEEPEEPKFRAFVGSGHRLDGKPATSTLAPAQPAKPASGSTRRPGILPLIHREFPSRKATGGQS